MRWWFVYGILKTLFKGSRTVKGKVHKKFLRKITKRRTDNDNMEQIEKIIDDKVKQIREVSDRKEKEIEELMEIMEGLTKGLD